MQKYILRSVKYFIMLCVLLAAVVWLNTFVNKLSYVEYWQHLLADEQGKWMIVAMVLLAASYPKFGYVTRKVSGDIVDHRAQIVKAFMMRGFVLCDQTDDELCFRATGLKRLTSLFEDEIRVSRAEGGKIAFSGLRRHAVQIALVAEQYIENYERNKDE